MFHNNQQCGRSLHRKGILHTEKEDRQIQEYTRKNIYHYARRLAIEEHKKCKYHKNKKKNST
jgi:hypothetical protein